MRAAVYVLCLFAAAWGVLAVQSLGAGGWWGAVPAAISVALAILVPRLAGAVFDAPRPDPGRARRAVMWGSLAEVVVIYLAVTLVVRLGRRELIDTVVALVVGLHFLPLAYFMPAPSYYGTGIALIGVAVAALLMPPPLRDVFVGAGSALVLWATTIDFVRICRRRAA